ncbi:MAG: selenium cofactor biosynthesis protein YqeC [Deltaproteobacteria bacterium]|nr:selenium cofactor biosynthesis protein YqeC [Deltaproteobacteria bacterium]
MKIEVMKFPDLVSALGIDSGSRCVALIGAGGKTSLMYALAESLVGAGKTVISTTSTKIFPPEPHQSPLLSLFADKFPRGDQIIQRLQLFRHITIGLDIDPNSGKVLGVTDQQIYSMLSWADHVILEADGASGRPIKAPIESEPVIPDFTDLVIPVIGLDSMYSKANQENVFRLHEFLRVTGLVHGALITVKEIVELFNHADGALRNVPKNAQVVVFLNKLDKLEKLEILSGLAWQMLTKITDPRLRSVSSGSLKFNRENFTKFIRC